MQSLTTEYQVSQSSLKIILKKLAEAKQINRQCKRMYISPGKTTASASIAIIQLTLTAHLQQLINGVFKEFAFAFRYLDDILIFSTNAKGHLKHLRIVFECMPATDLKLRK